MRVSTESTHTATLPFSRLSRYAVVWLLFIHSEAFTEPLSVSLLARDWTEHSFTFSFIGFNCYVLVIQLHLLHALVKVSLRAILAWLMLLRQS